MTPTARSLVWLRSKGWLVCVVEKWIPASPAGYKGRIVRQDAFGFGDLLAVRGPLTILVQCTTASNMSSRVHKIEALPAAAMWLGSAYRRIVVHGWSKKGPRGKRKVWTCSEFEIGFDGK